MLSGKNSTKNLCNTCTGFLHSLGGTEPSTFALQLPTQCKASTNIHVLEPQPSHLYHIH